MFLDPVPILTVPTLAEELVKNEYARNAAVGNLSVTLQRALSLNDNPDVDPHVTDLHITQIETTLAQLEAVNYSYMDTLVYTQLPDEQCEAAIELFVEAEDLCYQCISSLKKLVRQPQLRSSLLTFEDLAIPPVLQPFWGRSVDMLPDVDITNERIVPSNDSNAEHQTQDIDFDNVNRENHTLVQHSSSYHRTESEQTNLPICATENFCHGIVASIASTDVQQDVSYHSPFYRRTDHVPDSEQTNDLHTSHIVVAENCDNGISNNIVHLVSRYRSPYQRRTNHEPNLNLHCKNYVRVSPLIAICLDIHCKNDFHASSLTCATHCREDCFVNVVHSTYCRQAVITDSCDQTRSLSRGEYVGDSNCGTRPASAPEIADELTCTLFVYVSVHMTLSPINVTHPPWHTFISNADCTLSINY